MARWVTRENSARTLRRNVMAQAWGGSEPVCMLHEQARQEETRYLQVVPFGDQSLLFLKDALKKNDSKVMYHFRKKKNYPPNSPRLKITLLDS